jgi:ankyrin repeat protein
MDHQINHYDALPLSNKEKIIYLIKKDDFIGLSRLLKENDYIQSEITSMRSDYNKTIIQIAVESNNIDIVKMLCRFVYKKEDLSNTGAIGIRNNSSMDQIVE